MRKVGIFAGTFDPIHDGHLSVAENAIEFLELGKLAFLIEEQPWGDKDPVSYGDREAMLKLAIRDNPMLSVFTQTSRHFTLPKTLEEIEAEYLDCELYFVFGADIFMKMNDTQWPGLAELLKHYIVVFERKDITEKEITQHAKSLGIVVAILPSKHAHHASTDVRMHPHKSDIWVPNEVAEYIKDNELYN